MGYIDGSCCGDKVGHGAPPAQATEGENKGEERGRGPLGEAGVRAVMFPKEERKEREGGLWYEGRGMRVESRPDAREKEKRTVHKDGECSTMPRARANGVLTGPTQTIPTW